MPRDPDALFARAKTRAIPFDFVLEQIASLTPWTRPMFGCTAVYVGEKIVFALRDKKDVDTGVWVATSHEHHESLRREMPSLRSITVFGSGESAWQILPFDAEDFEDSVLRACALVRAGDVRIGKVPKEKKRKAPRSSVAKPAPARPDARVAKLLTALRSDRAMGRAVRDYEAQKENVAGRRAFGSNGLKANGRLFALFTQGTLVVKLPKTRVAALVESGVGEPFDPGHGRRMKEWLTVTSPKAKWLDLAREAFAFVRGAR